MRRLLIRLLVRLLSREPVMLTTNIVVHYLFVKDQQRTLTCEIDVERLLLTRGFTSNITIDMRPPYASDSCGVA